MAELEESIIVHTCSALYNALGPILFWVDVFSEAYGI